MSELVTNAVLHARSVFELVLRTTDDHVRIEVYDASPVLPSRKHYGIYAGTGRGILLVEALTEEWGAEATSSGKVVWFVIANTGGDDEPMAFELDAETLADLEALQGGSAPDVDPVAAPDPADEPSTCPSAHDRELVGADR